jgi:hypothetical protein
VTTSADYDGEGNGDRLELARALLRIADSFTERVSELKLQLVCSRDDIIMSSVEISTACELDKLRWLSEYLVDNQRLRDDLVADAQRALASVVQDLEQVELDLATTA